MSEPSPALTREFLLILQTADNHPYFPPWLKGKSVEELQAVLNHFATQPGAKQAQVINVLNAAIATNRSRTVTATQTAVNNIIDDRKDQSFKAFKIRNKIYRLRKKHTLAMMQVLRVLTNGSFTPKKSLSLLRGCVEGRLREKGRYINEDTWMGMILDEDWYYAVEANVKALRKTEWAHRPAQLIADAFAILEADAAFQDEHELLKKRPMHTRVMRDLAAVRARVSGPGSNLVDVAPSGGNNGAEETVGEPAYADGEEAGDVFGGEAHLRNVGDGGGSFSFGRRGTTKYQRLPSGELAEVDATEGGADGAGVVPVVGEAGDQFFLVGPDGEVEEEEPPPYSPGPSATDPTRRPMMRSVPIIPPPPPLGFTPEELSFMTAGSASSTAGSVAGGSNWAQAQDLLLLDSPTEAAPGNPYLGSPPNNITAPAVDAASSHQPFVFANGTPAVLPNHLMTRPEGDGGASQGAAGAGGSGTQPFVFANGTPAVLPTSLLSRPDGASVPDAAAQAPPSSAAVPDHDDLMARFAALKGSGGSGGSGA